MKNRLSFFLAVNTGYTVSGTPDDRFLDFYSTRSSPELYCAIVGNVVVPGGYGSNHATPVLSTDNVWRDVAQAIQSRGTRPGMQLATTWKGYVGSRNFVSNDPSRIVAHAREMATHLSADELKSIVGSFYSGAEMAITHGFTHIQIHAAHGYLLSLLIDQRINPNAEIVLSSLSALSEQLRSAGVETSLRISMRTGYSAFDEVGAREFQDRVAALPFDFIDMSSGFYNIDKRIIYPARPDSVAKRREESFEFGMRNPQRSFIISGGASKFDWSSMPKNIHFGICRDLIANPRFLQEYSNGCRNHGKCHYFSRGAQHISCGNWAAVSASS